MRSSVLGPAAWVEQKESWTSWRRPGKLSPVIPTNRLQFLYPEANLLDHLMVLLQQDCLAQSYFFIMLYLILAFHCLLNVLICTEHTGMKLILLGSSISPSLPNCSHFPSTLLSKSHSFSLSFISYLTNMATVPLFLFFFTLGETSVWVGGFNSIIQAQVQSTVMRERINHPTKMMNVLFWSFCIPPLHLH